MKIHPNVWSGLRIARWGLMGFLFIPNPHGVQGGRIGWLRFMWAGLQSAYLHLRYASLHAKGC